MFLPSCKKALQMVSAEYVEGAKKQFGEQMKVWETHLGSRTVEDVSKFLSTHVDFLGYVCLDFEQLLVLLSGKPNDKELLEKIESHTKQIVTSYYYVDAASDWICANDNNE